MHLEAILQYFHGERREMIAILAGSLVATLLTGGLFLLVRDSFVKALLVTVLISAALLSSTAGSLLARDARLRTDLVAAVQSAHGERALAGERTRVAAVISKYRYYRYGATGLGVLALLALTVSRKGWAHGAALGLLMLVMAQVVIDHYSEQRARGYFDRLAPAAPGGGGVQPTSDVED